MLKIKKDSISEDKMPVEDNSSSKSDSENYDQDSVEINNENEAFEEPIILLNKENLKLTFNSKIDSSNKQINEIQKNEVKREPMKDESPEIRNMNSEKNEMTNSNNVKTDNPKAFVDELFNNSLSIRKIKTEFSNFIINFREKDKKEGYYEEKINGMCLNNRQSLELNFTHINLNLTTIAILLAEKPSQIIPILNEALLEIVLKMYPSYENIYKEVFLRIIDFPVLDNIRELRQEHLGKLLKVRGIVTRRSKIYPQLKKVFYVCIICGTKKGPILITDSDQLNLGTCSVCFATSKFKLDTEETYYRNYQKLRLQETPGTIPAGRIPRQIEVTILNDLVDFVRPGDEIEITGILFHKLEITSNHEFPIYSTSFEANHISKLNEISRSDLTEEDKAEIVKLSKNPNIHKLIEESIAPSIFGNEFCKSSLTLALFGGVPKDIEN